MTGILSLWDKLREQLWFIPSMFCAAALVLVISTLIVDRSFAQSLGGMDCFGSTGDSARIVLGALVSALVTVAGLAFSLTIVAVSQTSSQYGPRLVRNLFEANITQNVLGIFLGTIVFSMVTLRSIRDGDDNGVLFTPHLSIAVAEFGGACCLLALLYLANHVTRCLRAETLVVAIHDELCQTLDRLLPDGSEQGFRFDASKFDDGYERIPVLSRETGYLRSVDIDTLWCIAERDDLKMDLPMKPGDFVHSEQPIATAFTDPSKETEVCEELQKKVRNCFVFGSSRTPRQDLEAAVSELVEIAVRALSPGVNDPVTAINVIDYLSSFLRQLVMRCQGGIPYWSSDAPLHERMCIKTTDFAGVLNASFDQLRQFATSSVAVHCRLLEGLAAIAEVTQTAGAEQAVVRQIEMALRHAEANIREENDLEDIRDRASTARQNARK